MKFTRTILMLGVEEKLSDGPEACHKQCPRIFPEHDKGRIRPRGHRRASAQWPAIVEAPGSIRDSGGRTLTTSPHLPQGEMP